jgi:preprotein translocase subunit SecG
LTAVLLIIHLFVTIALIGVVLIQRSEGGGLGIGSSQGMGAFMSGRGTANLLTRATVGGGLLANPPPASSAPAAPATPAPPPAPKGPSVPTN